MSPERERKRKRDADGQPRPVKATTSHQSIIVNALPAGQHPPMLASVHGVELPSDVKFTAYSKKLRSKSGTREEYHLHGQTQRIEYNGTAEGDDGLLNYYVGVFDPKTSTVDVYPAPLLHIRRQVRRLKEKEIPERATIGTVMDSRHALSAAFGNKTSRKALLDEQLNAITTTSLGSTAETSVVNAISSAVGEATALLPSREALRMGQGNSKYLPPLHNDEEGVTVDTVYKLDEMIGKKEMDACKVHIWEKEVNDGGNPVSTISPHYVQERIHQIVESGSNVTTRLKILRYIEHMIQFHRLFTNAFNQSLFRSKIYDQFTSDDKSITNSLMENFTDAKNQVKSDRVMSKTKLTRLYCWLLILCLKVEEDARMDLWDLVQDLQVDRKDVELAAREVGATVTAFPEHYIRVSGIGKEEAREHRMVRLSLPLQFPKNKMPIVKRR